LVSSGSRCSPVDLQVRFIEEPYLVSSHAASYRDYTAHVGRFVPCLERLT
jgi:protein-S-isoprenylcysteine O-methyltransferase Ste14